MYLYGVLPSEGEALPSLRQAFMGRGLPTAVRQGGVDMCVWGGPSRSAGHLGACAPCSAAHLISPPDVNTLNDTFAEVMPPTKTRSCLLSCCCSAIVSTWATAMPQRRAPAGGGHQIWLQCQQTSAGVKLSFNASLMFSGPPHGGCKSLVPRSLQTLRLSAA
jgi:hypothetical protein